MNGLKLSPGAPRGLGLQSPPLLSWDATVKTCPLAAPWGVLPPSPHSSQVGEGACTVLLSTLIPMATEMLANGDGTGFPELMVVMATLAGAGQGAGHLQLHSAALDWLGRW